MYIFIILYHTLIVHMHGVTTHYLSSQWLLIERFQTWKGFGYIVTKFGLLRDWVTTDD